MITIIVALEVIAILANFVMPLKQDMDLRQRARTIAREMIQVSDASLKARAGRTDWPEQQVPDAPPREITALLPLGFDLKHEDYHLEWSRWSIKDPKPLGLDSDHPAVVSLVADDPRLAALVAKEIPTGRLRYTTSNRLTLVVGG